MSRINFMLSWVKHIFLTSGPGLSTYVCNSEVNHVFGYTPTHTASCTKSKRKWCKRAEFSHFITKPPFRYKFIWICEILWVSAHCISAEKHNCLKSKKTTSVLRVCLKLKQEWETKRGSNKVVSVIYVAMSVSSYDRMHLNHVFYIHISKCYQFQKDPFLNSSLCKWRLLSSADNLWKLELYQECWPWSGSKLFDAIILKVLIGKINFEKVSRRQQNPACKEWAFVYC